MSLRCSLLGHSYGDAEIEREREEQGSEVVVTVREFKECERCGDRTVVTENKEVTAIQTPDAETETADVGAGSDPAEPNASSADAATAGGFDADSSPAVENEFEGAQSADEDDAVILDDEESSADDAADRDPGEWPDADSTHPAEVDDDGPGEWPDVGREDRDQGFDAEPGAGGDADVEFGGGLRPESAPEVDDGEADEVEFVNAEGDTLDADRGDAGGSSMATGFTSSGSVPAPDGPSEEPELDAEFVCPECGHREAVAGSSMRAGDICPECRKGYIAQE